MNKLTISGWKNLIVTVLAFAVAVPAFAADKDKAAKQQERRMRQMMQQVQAEKEQLQTQFEQEKTQLKQEAEVEQAKSDELKNSVANANRRNAALNAELEALRKEKTALQTAGQALQAKLEETQQQLANAEETILKGEAERSEMQAVIVRKQQQLNASNEKNAKLYNFGLQLIKIYERPSLYRQVMRDEPFTQLKRVELENILQEYKDKIDEMRVGTGDIRP
ncbi:hypothetical protein LG198_07720 [Methylobacillus arboreus]|nr:hypothetical protein [Methylobacillus arboreus]